MKHNKITLSLTAILSLTTLEAYDMNSVGYKATGMGGAGVASSRGSLATYYNPALIGVSDYTAEFSLNLGVGLRDNKLLTNIDKLSNLELTDTLGRIIDNAGLDGQNSEKDRDNIKESQTVLNSIPEGNGLQIAPQVSFTMQISKYFAIGAYASSDIRANMVIDKDKLQLIIKDPDEDNLYYAYYPDQDQYINKGITKETYEAKSLEYALDNNDTYLQTSALSLAEIPLSFAYPIKTKNGTFSLGISAKAMMAETYTYAMAIDSDAGNITDDYEENKKTYSTIGVDLGMAYRERETGITLGLVGKNINKPTFETEPDENGNIESFTLDPFFRAGISVPAWNDNIEFSIDADLQQSDTSYEGMKSQYVGGGFEFHPASWVALRAGAMKNIATESIDEGFIYTAGFGFGLKWLQVDLSAQMAQKKFTYDGEEYPKYAAVNFSIISRWGDGYKRKVPPTTEETPKVEPKKETPKIKVLDPKTKESIQKDAQDAQKELDNELKS